MDEANVYTLCSPMTLPMTVMTSIATVVGPTSFFYCCCVIIVDGVAIQEKETQMPGLLLFLSHTQGIDTRIQQTYYAISPTGSTESCLYIHDSTNLMCRH